jgi:hypothetical protein
MVSIIDIAKKQLPNLKVIEKKNSFLMKLFSILQFWQMKSFMTEFYTTVGNTVYVPSIAEAEQDPSRFLHEVIHAIDYNNNKLFYAFLYLLPFPFLFRSNYEKKAYLVQIYIRTRTIPNYDVRADWERMVKTYFHSSVYMWMNPCQNYDLPAELISDPNVKSKIDTMLNEYLGVSTTLA